MAITWNVTGPCEIWVTGSTATYALLGRTANDNLPRVNFIKHMKQETDTSSGAAPAQFIGNNQEATISCALVEWDLTVLAALETRIEDAIGTATVGKVMVPTAYASGGYFGVWIKPLITGRKGIQFGCCIADGESFVESQWGNCAKVLGLNLRAMPLPSTNLLYELTTT